MAKAMAKISRTAKKVARKATKKAEELLNTTKYSVQIKAKEVNLEEMYEKLGRLCYENEKNHTEQTKEALDNCIAQIDTVNSQILELKRQLAKSKDEIACPACGSYVSSDKDTCPSCKASLERIQVESAPDAGDGEQK